MILFYSDSSISVSAMESQRQEEENETLAYFRAPTPGHQMGQRVNSWTDLFFIENDVINTDDILIDNFIHDHSGIKYIYLVLIYASSGHILLVR